MSFFPELQQQPPTRQAAQSVSDAQLWCGDSHKLLQKIAADSVQLVLFSPPYDQLRNYDSSAKWTIDLHRIGEQAFRILQPGGVAVLVMQDQLVHGARSLTTFRTILDWVDNVGFRSFETLVYSRHGAPGNLSHYRFRVDHEYMPVLLKGDVPAQFHPEHMAERAVSAGKAYPSGAGRRHVDGSVKYGKKIVAGDSKSRGTVWHYSHGFRHGIQSVKFRHPATYPDQLAYDHILTWTAKGDTVVDPFVGSGSTAVAALAAGRKCIGIDVSADYIELARERCQRSVWG